MKRERLLSATGSLMLVVSSLVAGVVRAEPKVVEVRDSPQSATGKLLRKINVDWRCEYSEAMKSRPQLKGVTVPGVRSIGTERNFSDMHDWGVKLIRLSTSASDLGTNAETYVEQVRTWCDRVESTVIPLAKKYDIRVILLLSETPGGRERFADSRMFGDRRLLEIFREAWKLIARRFRGCTAIAGYDLYNEPHQSHFASVADYWTVQRLAAEDIRAIDPETPIIFEAYGWDGPEAFWAMSPAKLTNIVYEVHMYYPMKFTHQGIDSRPIGFEYPCASNGWNRAYLVKTFRQVREFEQRHGARIFCGEFSAATWSKGADRYIADCISVLNEYGWDWTYHSFREYVGWSVEWEGSDKNHCRPAKKGPTARQRALLEGLRTPTAAIRSADPSFDRRAPRQ